MSLLLTSPLYATMDLRNKGGIQLQHLLYYQDSSIKQFTANVVRVGQDDTGHFIVLSNTAFYPTGGGQPYDTGTINGIEIINVEKVEDEIRHYTTEAVSINGEVEGILNWQRRFDHMQQHAGQHILTAAFVELFSFETVSFHLGSNYVSIDLNVENVTEEQLRLAEQRANEIIREARPIETKFVTKDELSQYKLRKEVQAEGDIRLVIIPNFDYNGCGGTHPKSTAEVQVVKILETEKMRSNVRVHFICGDRVINGFHNRKEVLTAVAKKLSVPELEANTALEKFTATALKNEKELAKVKDRLLELEGTMLASEDVAAHAFENRSIQELQKLARIVVTQNEKAIALLVAKNDDKIQFVAARGADVTKSMKDVSAVVLPLLNGKGGGNDQVVQGGGDAVILVEDLLDAVKAVI